MIVTLYTLRSFSTLKHTNTITRELTLLLRLAIVDRYTCENLAEELKESWHTSVKVVLRENVPTIFLKTQCDSCSCLQKRITQIPRHPTTGVWVPALLDPYKEWIYKKCHTGVQFPSRMHSITAFREPPLGSRELPLSWHKPCSQVPVF